MAKMKMPRIVWIQGLICMLGAATVQAQYTQLHTFAGGAGDGALPKSSLTLAGTTLYGMTTLGGAANQGVIFRVNTDSSGYTNLHEFAGGANDGAAPYSGSLTLSGTNLYGMTLQGGTSGYGVIFKINTDGTGYTNLHVFSSGVNDGYAPYGALAITNTTLYGMTLQGGSGKGVVFKVNTDGSSYSNLHAFTGAPTDGQWPNGSLTLAGAALYGMTKNGGTTGNGMLFRVNMDGSGYTNLHAFAGGLSDGANPLGSLTLSGTNLFGMTYSGAGSTSGSGVVFRINADGSGYTNLHAFVGGANDGALPQGSLALNGTLLKGMTSLGGVSGKGVIFQINTDGTGYTNVHVFAGGTSDGALPFDSVTLNGATLFGMTYNGGASNNGVVFALSLINVTTAANPTNAGSVTGAGVYTPGTNMQLRAVSSNGWQFANWSDGATNNPYSLIAPGTNVAYTANFSQASTVFVLASPTNAGSVAGGGAYIVGSNATLTASASNNWLFTGWSGAGTNNPLTIAVPATNITYTALFAATAVINAGANTNAGGNVTGSGTFLVGSNATLTATASNGWQFLSWSDGVTNSPRTVLVTSNMNYTANFAPTAVIVVQANPSAGGSVAGGGTYVVGSNALLSATASNLWQFITWEDGVTNATRTVVTPSGGATFKADFGPLGTVNVLANPTNGGSVAGGGQYLIGSNATVTATASNNWLFTSWNGSITNNPWTFLVATGSVSCTGNFVKGSTVTVVASPTNAGTVTGGAVYVPGTNAILTATAASTNWQFIGWSGVGTNNPLSIVVPPTNITYTAAFAAIATIGVNVNTNAGGSVTGGGTFMVGSNVMLTATAANGWQFLNWNDGITTNQRTVTVVSNMNYQATFAPTATLTVLAAPPAGGNVTGRGTYVVGIHVPVTATASNLWRFIQWDDGVTNSIRSVLITAGGVTNTAIFSQLGAVVVQVNPVDSGDVSGDGQYVIGSNATVVASPYNGWHFIGWTGGETNNPWTFMVTNSATTCTANFVTSRMVTVSPNPANAGSVTGGGEFVVGTNVTLAATASNGWRFISWGDNSTFNPRTVTVGYDDATYIANFVPAATSAALGLALGSTDLVWQTGGDAVWNPNTGASREGRAAKSGKLMSGGLQSWFQTSTNGPGSLTFCWRISSELSDELQFTVNGQLQSLVTSSSGWQQCAVFLGSTNAYILRWTFAKKAYSVAGDNAGYVDQMTWLPCPYAASVPQLFYQSPAGMLASWVLNSTGTFQFARTLANTGDRVLKAAGDLDGDGVSDLFFETANGDLSGWFMTADGSVRETRSWGNLGGWDLKACGDYVGTGRGQLFFQTASGQTAYWLLDANGVYQSSVLLGNMGGWKLRGAGRLGDPLKADLLWQDAAGHVAIWHHNPDGSISSTLAFSTGGWGLCGVMDIDGDGLADLLWQDGSGNTAGWFMSSFTNSFSVCNWGNLGSWKLKAGGR